MKISSRQAFTLVEVLASVSVFAMILTMMLQVVGGASSSYKTMQARVDNIEQARVVLSLLERDVQSMVLRPDVAAFVDQDGSPACAFFTRMQGFSGDRRLSLVQYKMDASAATPGLARLDLGRDYTKDGVSLPIGETNRLADLKDAQPQDLTGGIVSFQCQFLNELGELQEKYEPSSSAPGALPPSRALVVSMVVLDNESHYLVTKLGKLPYLTSKFEGGAPAAQQSYAEVWNRALREPGFLADLPHSVAVGLRVFERRIALPHELTSL
jgi:prepilin-type N-terminal cleavage/methylation domain-containing protein